AVCAAPCMGPVLGTILVLAGSTTTVARGSVLLLAYSLGLALPFVLAGIAFSHVMGPFRWLRDHYAAIRSVSGALLVGIGLLLFFDRICWLSVAFNRALAPPALHYARLPKQSLCRQPALLAHTRFALLSPPPQTL